MAKGRVTLGFLSLLALTGCQASGTTEAPPEVITYRFDAAIVVNPSQPLVNRRVNLSLDVKSSSSVAVKTDILLQVVSKEGERMYETTWDSILFHEEEEWSLTQGFLVASDANKKPWMIEVVVTDHVTKQILHQQSLATLDFGS